MTRPSFYLVMGIVCLAVLASAEGASAKTDSLFQSLSVPTVEFSTFRGQSPALNFEQATCTPSSFFVSTSTNVPSEPRLPGNLCERTGRYVFHRIWSDYCNFYCVDTALNFGVALGGGAVLANTALDRHFSGWYQENIRSSGTDDFAKSCKFFGEGMIWAPVFVATAVSYRLYEQSGWNTRNERCPFGEYAARTARGYLVGSPMLWLYQNLLGSERPSANEKGSYWRPFHEDHAVSGHAFVGAMPFITAAQMVENPWLKGVFYVCSVLPAWSRVNDDAHYLSQTILGWYLAYLSVRAVSQTEETRLPKGLTIFPITEGRYIGLGLLYRR